MVANWLFFLSNIMNSPPFLFYSEKIPMVHEDIIIDKECAERLNVGNWINDNIIGLYCKLLKERQTRTPHKF